MTFGAYASHVVVPATALTRVPDNLELHRAAGLVQSYCTMWFALTRRMTVEPGQTVLVLGAGGGIGLASVDVAAALGAHVIAAASSTEKLDLARGGRRDGGHQLHDRGPEGAGQGALGRWRRRRRRSRRRSDGRARTRGPPDGTAVPRDRLRGRRHPEAAREPGAAQQPDAHRRRLGRVDRSGPARASTPCSTRSSLRSRTAGCTRRNPTGQGSTTPARCSRPCSTVSSSARPSWCPDRPRAGRALGLLRFGHVVVQVGDRELDGLRAVRRRRSARPAGSCAPS